MKEDVRRALEIVRVAVGTKIGTRVAAIERSLLEIPLGIARDEEIKASIAVVIKPPRARAPTDARHTRTPRHILKRSIASIAIEDVRAIRRDIQITESVRVVIASGNTHRIAFAFHSGACGHILKRPVALLMIKTIPELRIALVSHRPLRHRVEELRSVAEVQIETAIVIV